MELRSAVERLTLNDSSVSLVPESSQALGQGFRCGFLGVLHMEVFHQRLMDEHGADVVLTAPTVPYAYVPKQRGGGDAAGGKRRNKKNAGDGAPEDDEEEEVLKILRPDEFPEKSAVECYLEPVVDVTVMSPGEHVGALMTYLSEPSRRGEQLELDFLGGGDAAGGDAILRYRFPWSSVVTGMDSSLKSLSSGFASFDYCPSDPPERPADLVKVSMLINSTPVGPLSFIAHRSQAQREAKSAVEKLKKAIKRQQYEIRIQAAIGGGVGGDGDGVGGGGGRKRKRAAQGFGRIVASATVKSFRKNVLIKSGKTVGGGDYSRKQKLLQRQKKGKKALKEKTIGNVSLPQSAFLAVLSR